MAAMSSTESCTAPEKFNLSSSNYDEDSPSRLSLNNNLRCPLCIHPRKRFHCRDCIRNGDFHHSQDHKVHVSERYNLFQLLGCIM